MARKSSVRIADHFTDLTDPRRREPTSRLPTFLQGGRVILTTVVADFLGNWPDFCSGTPCAPEALGWRAGHGPSRFGSTDEELRSATQAARRMRGHSP